jgi:hypothetical protein
MKLRTIDKARYRKNLNRLMFGCAAGLMIGALTLSTLLIALIGNGQVSHFYLNLTGVAVSGFIVTALLNHFKHHQLMTEVYYVWLLKKQLNLISRKLTKVELGVDNADMTAMIILNFYYQGSHQLWQLDDNTITMDTLKQKMTQLENRLTDNAYNVTTDDYSPALLIEY